MRRVDFVLNLFFPPRCVSCDELLDHRKTDALCPHCRSKYEIEKGFLCPDCGNPHKDCSCLPTNLASSVNEAIHLTEYMKEESVARDLILRAKDGRAEYLYRMLTYELSTLIETRVSNPSACLFTYVPRSTRRKAESGIDQAQEVAKRLSKAFGADFASVLGRSSATEQKRLTARERRDNVGNAYRLLERKVECVRKRHVILYDDVMTTGATLAACARLLKKAGASYITVVTFGKVYLEKSKEKTPILKSERSSVWSL